MKNIINLLLIAYIFSISTCSIFSKSNSGITLAPSFIEYSVKPGDELLVNIQVQNHDDSEVKIMPVFANTSVDLETGETKIIYSSETPAASWITYGSSEVITIKKGETKLAPFSLKIPPTAEPKGYYPAIILSFQPVESGENVSTSYRLGSRIYLNVLPPDSVAEKKLDIKFRSNKKLTLSPNVTFNSILKNTGKYHIQPRGIIEVYDPVDMKQENSLTLNDKLQFLLPGQTINETKDWEDITFINKIFPPIGYYNAVLKVYDGQANEGILGQESTRFLVIPPQYILFAIVVMGTAGYVFYKKLKKKRGRGKGKGKNMKINKKI